MTADIKPSTSQPVDTGAPVPVSGDTATRVATLVEEHADFVWRALRRLGVPESQADDATQEVFIVAMKKVDQMEVGRERAYLFGIAAHTAAHVRRSYARRKEVATAEPPPREDTAPGPDVALDDHRARVWLDRVLESMPDELRVVLVLYEIENITMAEIARMLDLAPGTVASRLRRAREEFQAAATRARLAAATTTKGGGKR